MDGTPVACKTCNGTLRYLNKNGEIAELGEKVVEFGCPDCTQNKKGDSE